MPPSVIGLKMWIINTKITHPSRQPFSNFLVIRICGTTSSSKRAIIKNRSIFMGTRHFHHTLADQIGMQRHQSRRS